MNKKDLLFRNSFINPSVSNFKNVKNREILNEKFRKNYEEKNKKSKPMFRDLNDLTMTNPISENFISENEKVTEKQLREFFASLEEELGNKPTWSWVRKNSQYVNREVSESGDVFFNLTKRGQRALAEHMKLEKQKVPINANVDLTKIAE